MASVYGVLKHLAAGQPLPLDIAVMLSNGGWARLWARSVEAESMCTLLTLFFDPLPAAAAIDVAIAGCQDNAFALAYAQVAQRVLRDEPPQSETGNFDLVAAFGRAIAMSTTSKPKNTAQWQCVRYALFVLGYERGLVLRDNGTLNYVGTHYPVTHLPEDTDPRLVLSAVLDTAQAAGASWSTLASIVRKHAPMPTFEQIIAASISMGAP